MVRRLSIASAAGLLMALAASLPVAAGGWASMIPDAGQPPSDGGTTVISFTLLQHGVTPVDFGQATVVASNIDDGSVIRAQATPDPGSAGHWTARLTVATGTWTYMVSHTDLQVQAPDSLSFSVGPAAAGGAATATSSPSSAVLALALAGMVAAACLLGLGFALAYRRRVREAGYEPRT